MPEADSGFSVPSARTAGLFREALDCLADGVCLTDLDGRPFFANAVYRRLRPGTAANDDTTSLPPGQPLSSSHTSRLLRDPDGTACAWLHVVTEPAETGQSERAIRESEERYRVILQSISDAVFIVNEHGIIETVNDAAASEHYVAPDRLNVGVSLEAVLPSRMARRRLEALRAVLACGEPRVIEEQVAQGGSPVCLSTTVNPLVNADGSCSKVVMVSRDITADREREAFLRGFSRSILAAQEAERKRVAGELHDGLAQSLAALRVALRQVEQSVPASDTAQRERVRAAMDSVKALLEDTRRIAHNLTPVILEDIGLGAAIDRLLRTFSDTPDASTGREVIALDGLFRPGEQIQIYRVLQEVFNNIDRHAAAHRVDLTIRRADHAIEFEVRDDGVGFEVERTLRSSPRDVDHQGLRGLQERARLLGGTLVIHSAPGGGTSVVLAIPVSGPETTAPSYGGA
jgi:PAS domain S-box-containing protein